MTSMLLQGLSLNGVSRDGFWRHGCAAGCAVVLHVAVLALLVRGGFQPPPAETPAVLHTQLVMLPPAPQPQPPAPAQQPVAVAPAPAATAAPEPVVAAPVKPAVDPRLQAQKLQQAALARKRVEQKKIQQQREQQETARRARAEEQQRLAAQQAQQQAQEQARLAAAHTRQQAAAQAAADSRQYLPLSKNAPDYPQRALDKNLEGDCSVEYTVNPQGKVENPKVLEGCHPLFIRPSLAAASTFRYQPRVIAGKAVAVPAVRNTFHYRIQ